MCFKLKLPDAKLPREIHLKAEKGGEIDVFLCPDTSPEATQTPCDPLLDDIKPLLTPIIEKYLSPRFRKGLYIFVIPGKIKTIIFFIFFNIRFKYCSLFKQKFNHILDTKLRPVVLA